MCFSIGRKSLLILEPVTSRKMQMNSRCWVLFLEPIDCRFGMLDLTDWDFIRVLPLGDDVFHSPLFCSYHSSSKGFPHSVPSFSFCYGAEGVEGKEGTHFPVAFHVPSDNCSRTRKGGKYWTCSCSHPEPWWFLWNLVQSFQFPSKLLIIFLLCAICGSSFQ